jgi:hypothetical protein
VVHIHLLLQIVDVWFEKNQDSSVLHASIFLFLFSITLTELMIFQVNYLHNLVQAGTAKERGTLPNNGKFLTFSSDERKFGLQFYAFDEFFLKKPLYILPIFSSSRRLCG